MYFSQGVLFNFVFLYFPVLLCCCCFLMYFFCILQQWDILGRKLKRARWCLFGEVCWVWREQISISHILCGRCAQSVSVCKRSKIPHQHELLHSCWTCTTPPPPLWPKQTPHFDICHSWRTPPLWPKPSLKYLPFMVQLGQLWPEQTSSLWISSYAM